jgi:rfaE bifunctional protein nucleotidyltransferase chain/domain
MQGSKYKIWSRGDAGSKASALKQQGLKLVFTNGVFDILHAGHVQYLEEAAAMGDFLVLGLNTDSSVQRLGKSPARPLQDEYSRAHVLAALGCIGCVVLFDEDTPYELISEIKPDVLVKGADYSIENIAGADIVKSYGGQVATIAFLPGYSTTAIEKKIIEANS